MHGCDEILMWWCECGVWWSEIDSDDVMVRVWYVMVITCTVVYDGQKLIEWWCDGDSAICDSVVCDGDSVMNDGDSVILTAICSLDWTGWNPTNEICIERIVPRQ